MKTRIDAGTDVAMIGAWDRSRNDCVLANAPFKEIMNTVLLFPLLVFPLGWKMALGVTLVIAVGWFYVRGTFFLKPNARYQRIDKAVNEMLKREQEAAPPTFIFELKCASPGCDLKGGKIKV